MRKLMRTLVAGLVLTLCSGLQADVVNVDLEWENNAPVAGNPNTGGLDNNMNEQLANGSDVLNLAFTVNSTTGASYDGVLTLAGVTEGGANEVSVNGAGRVTFVQDGPGVRQDLLTVTVSSLVESTSTGNAITFDGFSTYRMDQFSAAGDSFTFDGVSYTGDIAGGGNNGEEVRFFNSLGANGSTFDRTGTGQFRLGGMGMQFTVSAVPEPSSFALLGLMGLGFLRRKRS